MTGTSITTLFLDIGGVLLTNGWDRTMRRAGAEKFGLDYEEMNERHHLTFDTYEEGKLSLDDYLDRVVFFEPRTFTREEFRGYMFQQSRPFSDMIVCVRALKERYGLRVAAVSNEGRELTEYRIATFRLKEIIDFFISSCYVHYRKPDADIYRIALDIAGVAPEEVVYIEDRPMYVDIARGMGINSIRHEGCAATCRELERFGLLPPAGVCGTPALPADSCPLP